MEDTQEIHRELINWAKLEYKEILDDSDQSIYLYICDKHRLANENFVSMLGYKSVKEWERKDEMMSDVKEEDKDTLIFAYQNAMENKVGSSIKISWINKRGTFVKTNVILVPLSYKGTMFALHFIKKI